MDTSRSKGRRTLSTAALTVLRVGVGAVFVAHGWTKVADVNGWQQNVASLGVPFPEIAGWLALLAEFAGGIALILGALTPLAALGLAITMGFAIAHVHWGNGLFAANNGFELPLVLGLVAFFFMVRGAGPVSVDALVRRSMSRRRHGESATRDERAYGREYAGAPAR